MPKLDFTKPPYRIGKAAGAGVMTCVVADDDTSLSEHTGAAGREAVGYYGGNLIAESVSPENAAFIVAACNFYWTEVQAGRIKYNE